MFTAPATASNSSSASRMLNWQPSQEANLKNATLGLCPSLELIFLQPRPHLAIGEDGPVFADEFGTELAMAAEADAAFHVALHRDVDVAGGQAARFEVARHVPHHDLRPAHHGQAVQR